ncbi:MAG: hypothetical protein K6E68_08575 [Lachnospiraceae bacterium]|nr:hypothetical protein [Lachnospiraceae bacterium]
MGSNAISFINTFLSYALLYVVFGACVIAAVFAGIAVRKRKNLKDAAVGEQTDDESQK